MAIGWDTGTWEGHVAQKPMGLQVSGWSQ